MGEHSQLIILWAANLASQPNTARHLLAAKRRGAQIVTIDVRRTEAAAKSDEVLIIRPGTDTALALALMHVICAERHATPVFWQCCSGRCCSGRCCSGRCCFGRRGLQLERAERPGERC